jgi:hypothetical protein
LSETLSFATGDAGQESDPGEELTFETLRGLDERIRLLQEKEVEYLGGFW